MHSTNLSGGGRFLRFLQQNFINGVFADSQEDGRGRGGIFVGKIQCRFQFKNFTDRLGIQRVRALCFREDRERYFSKDFPSLDAAEDLGSSAADRLLIELCEFPGHGRLGIAQLANEFL
jgi:hypothetical protein